MCNAALEKRRALHIYSVFAIPHEAPDVANNITYSAAELITLHCFIFNLVFLSLLLAPLANAGETRYEILKKTYENRLNDADIHIVGRITDIDNNELENVFLEIEFIRPKNVWATESERLCDSRKVNGKFLLQKKNYTAVSITFIKDGYRSQNITFYTGKKTDEPDSARQTQYHIKLRKIGILAKLIKFDERIEYNIKDHSQSICNLSKLADGKLGNEVINLGNPITFKKYLYLDFDRNKQGEIIYEKDNGRGIHAPAPKTYLLNFVSSDPSDGFILIDEKTPVKDFSFLTDAPLKNYTTKKLIIPYNPDKRYYFYIRCGKFYGKGVIKNIGARNGAFSHEYSLLVEILFNQKPGDINLNSL